MKLAIILIVSLALCSCDYIPTGFTSVPLSSLKTDSTIQYAYMFGKNTTISNLIQGNYISNHTYVVLANVSISQKVSGTTTYYAFEVQLNNYVDYIADITYIVSKKSSTYKLYTYSANITQMIYSQFIPLNITEASANPLILALEAYGMQLLVGNVVSQLPAVSANFDISQVNDIQMQNLPNGTTLYKFTIDAINSNNDTLISAYVLSFTDHSVMPTLINLAYITIQTDQDSENTDLSTNGYIQLGASDVNSTLVQSVLNSGIQELLVQGLNDGTIMSTNFQLASINSVWSSSSLTDVNYRFDVVLSNSLTSTIYAVFIVDYEIDNGSVSLGGFSYTIKSTSS